MSSSLQNHCSNGTVTLKSFAELASVLDVDSLPPGPADAGALDGTPLTTHQPVTDGEPQTAPTKPADLASVISQLAQVSSDLEIMARSDARAREQATIELAQYETLAA